MTVFGMAQVTSILYILFQAGIKDAQSRCGVRVFEISFARSILTILSASVCVFVSGQNPFRAVTRDLVWPLAIRCVAGALAFITVTTALPLLPLILFQVITNMTPFLAALLACLWLGEKLSFFQLVCMLLCFGGIAVVIFERDTSKGTVDKEFNSFNYGVILTCIVAMIFAVTAVTTRKVKALHWSVVTFYFELACFIISGAWILYESRS